MPKSPKLCTLIYFISCILDVFDGLAARKLGQESKFGAVLDMVTDRCATACLLCFLSSTYPQHSLLIMFLITLDFSSHYIHMYS
jgi:CDP-diacylglycerol--inositol 3-phosphatidyltransferase